MGLTNSLGKRPARLHSSMMGMRLSSMNLREVSRTRSSSSVRRASKPMKSTPRNFRDMGFSFLLLGEHGTIRNEGTYNANKGLLGGQTGEDLYHRGHRDHRGNASSKTPGGAGGRIGGQNRESKTATFLQSFCKMGGWASRVRHLNCSGDASAEGATTGGIAGLLVRGRRGGSAAARQWDLTRQWVSFPL